ncbi:SagB/ThcOx family dehydrogenase [Micromonospora sp. NBC_01699]|uniref:SagB/ThcOx family dehydrogenase n=1 Tax=Micromonospora sp. NBC_01699 TaxID=2975984 RepID=UPI002E317AD6|nr:SagB/ThcOx family dehydrogenase [Micromonospora sp. NBC_01699]
MELRRARSLVAYWVNGEMVLDDYLDRTSENGEKNGVAVDGTALDILSQFDDWTDPEQVSARFDGYDPASVLEAVTDLTEAGLLRTRQEAEEEDRVLDRWEPWGQSARFFHFDTKDTAYISTEGASADPEIAANRAAVFGAIRASGPAPEMFSRNADAERIMLTRSFLPLDRDFGDVLMSRRTHRYFTEDAVPLRSFSTVLHHTFAPMHFFDAGVLGMLMLRTSPSGGARHESECYVAVRNVESIPPGLYRYSPSDHSLEVVSYDFDTVQLGRISFDQKMITTAGFVCFLTINLQRAMFKYRSARMLRTVLLDTGHLAQTFALCVTAVGLGPCQTDAFRDSELEAALGIDGADETAVYVLAAGVPARRTDGLPVADAPDEVGRRTLSEPVPPTPAA